MTITTNIHPGLPSWTQNHAYSVLGFRISNGGNAYQVITTGTSQNTPGAGPTGTSSNITDGTVHWKWLSAIDFTTLQGWFNSIAGTMTDNVVGQIWNDAPITTTAGSTLLAMTGVIPGVFTITLTAAPGEGIRDSTGALAFNSAKGACIILPTGTGSVNYITADEGNVIFDGIQIQDPNSTSNCTMIEASQPGFRIQNCILDGFSQTGGASMLDFAPGMSDFVVENTLVVDRRAGDSTDCTAVGVSTGSSITGAFANCTFISTTANTAGFAIDANNTNTGGVKLTNCAFFGWSNPATNLSHSLGVTANHCCTNATAFPGSVTNGTGNLFGKVASNQFVSATTDFRLTGTVFCDCQNEGTTDSTDIPSADDIRRTSRPQGPAWDIGCFEYGSVVSAKILGLVMAQAPADIRGIHKPYVVSSTQVLAPAAANKAGNNKAVTVLAAEVVLLQRVRGKVYSLTDADSAAVATRLARTIFASLTGSNIARLTKRSVGHIMSAASTEVALALKALAKIPLKATSGAAYSFAKAPIKSPSVASPSSLSMLRQVVHFTSIVSAQAMVISRLVSHNLAVATAQVRSIVLKAPTIAATRAFSVASASIASLSKAATLTILKVLSAVSAESLSLLAGRFFQRGMTALSPDTASTTTQRQKPTILSGFQGYLASLARSIAHLAPVGEAQFVSAIKTPSRLFQASDPEAVTVIRGTGAIRSAASPASQSMKHPVGKAFLVLSREVTTMFRALSQAFSGATTTQSASTATVRTLVKALAAIDAQVAALSRGTAHLSQAISGSAVAVLRSIVKFSAAIDAQVIALASGLGATRPLIGITSNHQTVTSLRGINHNLALLSGEVVTAVVRNRGRLAFVASGEGVTVSRVTHILRGTGQGNLSLASKLRFRLFSVASHSATASEASRAVSPGAIQAMSALVVRWYHLFVPESEQQNRVLLPPADGPPEPPFFSAMDPADQAIFLFDWSARAEPGDLIASASVTSVPLGLNFVGPLFVDNMVVEVTVGPAFQPQLPITYGLRCSVIFVSGERSNFTIPVPIRTL